VLEVTDKESVAEEEESDEELGIGDVGVGEILESVGVDVTEEEVLVLPPVIEDPVMGMGVVIKLPEVVALLLEDEEDEEPVPAIFVMAKAGLVLPESPNKTMR